VVLRCRQRRCRFGRSPPLNPSPNQHDTLRVRYTHSLSWLCRRGVVPRSASIASTIQHGWGLNRACSHHTPVSVGTDQGICGCTPSEGVLDRRPTRGPCLEARRALGIRHSPAVGSDGRHSFTCRPLRVFPMEGSRQDKWTAIRVQKTSSSSA
jgi:hypothetical protein